VISGSDKAPSSIFKADIGSDCQTTFLIGSELQSEYGSDWWNQAVPQAIQTNVQLNIQKEIDTGVTQRSTEEIDYTTFGELGEIVRNNWESFSDTFNSQKAFNKVMTYLNTLRGPKAGDTSNGPWRGE